MNEGLLAFIPHLSPEFSQPDHLGELGDLFEQARAVIAGESDAALRALCTYPIRHQKTETICHGVVWLLKQFPSLRVIVLTHSHERAKWLGKRIRELAGRTDVGPAKGWNTIDDWQNNDGGGVVVMSADQSKEGHDCHVLICDDPIDEHGAATSQKRDEVDRAINYYTARCMRYGRPGPVFLIMSRQHPDDPIGLRLKRTAVEWIHLHRPAIIDLGMPSERAFAPLVWSLAALKALREEQKETDPLERVFWSRLQGEPRVEGASYYGTPAYYTTLPTWPGFRDAIGIDMSYQPKRVNDWFAIVSMRIWPGQAYLRNVMRFKPDPREVPSSIRSALAECPGGAPIFSYVSGPEFGVVQRLNVDHNLAIQPMQARVNKLWRTQRTIKRWNSREILVPSDQPWSRGFVKRIQGFTGLDGDEDDESDALVSVCDGMLGMVGGPTPGLAGNWRFG